MLFVGDNLISNTGDSSNLEILLPPKNDGNQNDKIYTNSTSVILNGAKRSEESQDMHLRKY